MKALWPLILQLFFLAMPHHAFGAITQSEYEELSDALGTVNAWRMIPEKLLERCEVAVPQSSSARNESYRQWKNANRSLLSLIEKAVKAASPIYAELLHVSPEEAQRKLNDGTASMIQENYFKDPRFTTEIICSSYDRILSELSEPGKVATTRGRVYQIESLMLKLSSKQSGATKPNMLFDTGAVPRRST